MREMKKMLHRLWQVALILSALLTPEAAFAHARRLIGEEPLAVPPVSPTFFWIAGALALVLFFFFRALSSRPVGGRAVKVLHLQAMPFVGLAKNSWSIGLGAALILLAARGELFSPDIVATTEMHQFIRILEFISGIGFLLLSIRRFAALILILALMLLWMTEGVVAFFLYADYMGLALAFLFAYAQGKFSLRFAMRYARIGLGVAFIVSAFHEKLLAPGSSLTFLAEHGGWNVFAALGLPVSGIAFISIVGLAEVFLGALLVMNVFPRFAALGVLLATLISWILLGTSEFIGHLVTALIALFVAFYGTDYFHFTEEQEIEL